MSLAKYLWIIDSACDPQLDIHQIERFLMRVLERVDWSRDLHFQTRTTIDTLDYSGSGLNEGSKVVIAAAGPASRTLPTEFPEDSNLLEQVGPDFSCPIVCLPGVVAISGPAWRAEQDLRGPRDLNAVERFCAAVAPTSPICHFPLIVIVDDSKFCGESLENFLWITFTRSNPAADIYGINARYLNKHWGCTGSLVIDARIKRHHAPVLIADPLVSAKIDALAARGGPLARYL
jgi:4-hydroxy-3-polyprenylbenzoate decarboxylase